MILTWAKSLKVGKVDRYSIDLTNWLNGQSIISATIAPVTGIATAGTTSIDGNVISWLITGVGLGVEKFDVAYTTATRSDCEEVQLKVEAC